MTNPEQAPEHITDTLGQVTISGGWYTHQHSHRHDGSRVAWDGSPINHTQHISHRHEHCWQPQERHHHPVDAPPEVEREETG